MRKSAWYMTFLSAAALAGAVGCGDNGVDPCAPGSGLICPDAGPGEDGGGVIPDSGDRPDRPTTPTGTCGDVGRSGGLCRDGVCFTGLTCFEELAIGAEQLNARNTFGYEQAAAADPTDPDTTYTLVATPVPANDVPVTFATGSLCTEQCDDSAATDSCGTCAKCSQQIGNDPLGIPSYAFIQAITSAPPLYGDSTGLCRPHCTFDPEGRGMGCPEGYTCDGFTNLCLEACRNDAQCQARVVIAEEGEVATYVPPTSDTTCNMTTGRCDWAGPAAPHVGDVCDSSSDCRADTGFCLRGGSCVQTQCNRADIPPGDTSMTDFTCDGGRGICLGTGGNMGAICIDGCNTPNDCNPGNSCLPLGSTAGSFSGYCLGICDTVSSGAMDELLGCRTDEQCDMPAATPEDMDPDGTCRPTCNPAAPTSECETGEVCEAVAGSTPAYGFCRALGDFCVDSDGCFNGQICDGEIGAARLGRCVDPCTADTDCTVGDATTCVTDTANALVGLCAETCTLPADCNAPGITTRTCRVAVGTTTGYCVETPAT